WARERGFEADENRQGQLHVWRAGQHITIENEAIDVWHFMARGHGRRGWDLLIGQAFFGLIGMPTTLPRLFFLGRPGGLLYFPTTFDGDTAFQPDCEPEFDRAIEACYHQAIDQRVLDGKPSGDSRAGRRLFAHLRTAAVDVLAAGGSDWVVFAGANGY